MMYLPCKGSIAALLLLTTLSNSACVASFPTATKTANDNAELAAIYREDQRERVGIGADIGKAAANLSGNDLARSTRVKELYVANRLNTGFDFFCAALVLQHGHTSDDYLLAHELSVVALAKGEGRARWLAAATQDRFLMEIKRPQRFGTQFYLRRDKQWELYKTAEGVTDQLRAQLDVPSLREAVQRQAALNRRRATQDEKPSGETEPMPEQAQSVPMRGEAVDSPIVGRWRGLAPNGAALAFNSCPIIA